MTLHPRVCVTNGGGTAQRANARARDGTLLGLGKLSILTAIRRRVFLTVYSSLESPRRSSGTGIGLQRRYRLTARQDDYKATTPAHFIADCWAPIQRPSPNRGDSPSQLKFCSAILYRLLLLIQAILRTGADYLKSELLSTKNDGLEAHP
jgi:hypothetical protein